MNGMEPFYAEMMDYDEYMFFTDNLSEENLVGTFQFGKLYRAKFQRFPHRTDHVMVKIWEIPEKRVFSPSVNLARMMHEYFLLRHYRLAKHPGMIEFGIFCWDGEHVAALYNFNPHDTVHNLVPKDSFTWIQRIKVAYGFACLLKFLHAGNSVYNSFVVHNIAAAHIVVDEEYNPKLYDYGMISGGIFPETMMYECRGCYGYVDPNIGRSGKWSKETDVFAFGVVLLNLITKRVDTEEQSNAPLLYSWAWDVFESSEAENGSRKSAPSLVDQSLTTDPGFSSTDGLEITDLAMKCISRSADERPTMKQVVRCLQKLQTCVEFVGVAAAKQ